MNRDEATGDPGPARTRRAASAPVRLEDVARLAGVSTASVSRVFNSPHMVSEETRERVSRAAKVLNWVPNGAAQALASMRSRIIGALIPTLSHQNFAHLVEALQLELAKAQYTLLIGCDEDHAGLREPQARKMIERGVECVVLVGEEHPAALYDLMRAQNVPHVITYATSRDPAHTCIGFDNYAASCSVTQHLLDLGHRKFGLLAASPEGNDRIRERIEGVKDTLAQAGLGIKPQHFVKIESPREIDSGRQGLKTVLAGPTGRPTAVVCTNDYVATGALIEAKAQRISVPKDLSIAGFDDVDLSAHLDPPLTTVRVPAREIGQQLARYLIRFLDYGEAEKPAPLQANLVVRASTARPPRS